MEKLTQQILATYKEQGQQWLDRLPTLIIDLSERWRLSRLTPFENLSWNYVAHGLQQELPVVLKLSCDLSALQREASALQTFGSSSCPKVLALDLERGALLLEQALPGKSLMHHSFKEPQQTLKVACELTLKLKDKQQSVSFPFESVANLLEGLGKDWDLPANWLETARALSKKLVRTMTPTHLIHGDLHRENIISHGNQWVAIDPKGYVGTLYNEVWPFIHEPEREIPLAAQLLGLETHKLRDWCFVHAILAATWCLEDGIEPSKVFSLAKRIGDEL
jgi:streptomycin 6-kinase